MAIIVSAERVRELENALRELRDNIGTGWSDDQLKAFADRALMGSGGFPKSKQRETWYFDDIGAHRA